ncbi:ATP-binding protein [Candidatus Methylospira mobilis]|uniref:ATP-binding protein n=1 Tax=Candidatus Methylospira mobilis TaxID=1808979 RepID=A0A5Q0BK71_9GAMM|nr:AAA family ATPase [Candidatus Methylospira mobilis]QFY42558.1 ATP-binding protein [Candidatus Methylospira mobilis]WNV04324.1 AAA family ATPase [Candidatus Methylospira mobilis]
MHIIRLSLQNFKRFTDLTIQNIPSQAKLVLLIGANGSGKSCVFDAFNWIAPGNASRWHGQQESAYFKKEEASDTGVMIESSSNETFERSDNTLSQNAAGKFYGRSSLRIVPHLKPANHPGDAIENDQDAPRFYIEQDERFFIDVQQFTANINKAARAPLFKANSLLNQTELLEQIHQIQAQYIAPLNASLARIFGETEQTSIRLENYEDAEPGQPIKLNFRKGGYSINFDLLSHGEKQVVILLLNFAVRKNQLRDKILYIDEMDAHMNTRLQFDLLQEIVEHWIPDDSQLWTASHALGFIDYARKSAHAAIIDFDSLDFDEAQTIEPVEKINPQLYEIAVSSELLGELANNRQLIFVENNDINYYKPALATTRRLLLPARDKTTAYFTAQALAQYCLIDRDYLSDDERNELLSTYSWLRLLNYYSVENYLYHPENVSELTACHDKAFDRFAYETAWRTAKNRDKAKLLNKLDGIRKGYPFFKEPGNEKLRKTYEGWQSHQKVADMLDSDDFETFFKVYPAKDHGGDARGLAGFGKDKLASTQWFQQQIRALIEPEN